MAVLTALLVICRPAIPISPPLKNPAIPEEPDFPAVLPAAEPVRPAPAPRPPPATIVTALTAIMASASMELDVSNSIRVGFHSLPTISSLQSPLNCENCVHPLPLPAKSSDFIGFPLSLRHIVGNEGSIVASYGVGGIEQHRQQVFLDVANFRGVLPHTVHDELNMVAV